MGKGANSKLLSNSGVASSTSKGLQGQAGGVSSYLTPQLENEANNPQGFTPAQLSYMNTASEQSLGGGAAATTGEADLASARTRNAGGFQGVVGDSNRATQKQASQNSVQIQADQAKLQQQQRQQALSSLQSLYGIDEQTALGYLNSSNSALNDEESASANQSKIAQGYVGMGLNELGQPNPLAGVGQG